MHNGGGGQEGRRGASGRRGQVGGRCRRGGGGAAGKEVAGGVVHARAVLQCDHFTPLIHFQLRKEIGSLPTKFLLTLPPAFPPQP